MQFSKMLVIDLECTCFRGDDEDKPRGWTAEKDQEIIEIGAVIVDLAKREVCHTMLEKAVWNLAEASILARPDGPIGKFCTELTTLTPEHFDPASYENGISGYGTIRPGPPPLVDALADLKFFCKQWKFDIRSMPWGSWGDYDRVQFYRECARKGLEYPFGRAHYNIKGLYSMLTAQGKGYGLAKALEQQGLPLEGTHHRGVDDARNTAKLLLHCLGRSVPGLLGKLEHEDHS